MYSIEFDWEESFLDLKTPREVLIAAYDLLEVTRHLDPYRSGHNALHYDIAEGNVWIKPAVRAFSPGVAPAPPCNLDDSSCRTFCFVSHLLDESVSPNASTCLLVDFDHSHKEDCKTRPGAPKVLARAAELRNPIRPSGDHVFLASMPTLSPEPHERYKTVLPDRWDRFPPTKAQIVNYQLKDKRTWRHELRHDAESVLWLLVWWAVHAWPVTVRDWDDSRYIPHGPYKSLVGDAMARGTYMCVFPKDALHQHYCGLLPLLVKLTSQLSGDYHWAVDGIFTHPDFVHEAFQRHIFEFLVNNKGASFMDLQRRNSPRPLAKAPKLLPYAHHRLDGWVDGLRTLHPY